MRIDTDLLEDVELHGATKLDIGAAAKKVKAPWLIIHGTGDETVKSSEAERLHELSPGVSTLRARLNQVHAGSRSASTW